MIGSHRYARRAVWLAAIAGAALVARPAAAQDAGTDAPAVPDCTTLTPTPVFLTGSSAFEATVKNFAVKFSALATSPFTIVYSTPGSCVGVDNIVNNKDLTGTAHYYTLSGTTVVTNTCALPAAGQKADVGISDVFYDSCTSVTPQPIPTALKDFPGPAQAMLFVVPKTSTATYITALEAADLYGCGAGYTGNITPFTSPADEFCRDPNSGTQITIATNINIPATAMVAPVCVPPPSSNPGTNGVISGLTSSSMPQKAIGFISEDAYDGQRANLSSLAFQAFNQTLAYLSDSAAGINDRANVRDGHYVLWGYEHMFAAVDTTGAITNPKAASFIGFINGTKTDTTIDPVAIEGAAGTIPICAMKVQRAKDGVLGPLSYATVADPCNCAFEAAATKSTPTGCVTCTGTGTSTCTGGKSCHHGFCE